MRIVAAAQDFENGVREEVAVRVDYSQFGALPLRPLVAAVSPRSIPISSGCPLSAEGFSRSGDGGALQ
jgi:hypothetical protein